MKLPFLTSFVLAVVIVASGCGTSEKIDEKDTGVVHRGKLVVWVSARGKVLAESNVTIAPPKYWGLKILKLVAEEGTKVKKGDVLLELDTERLEERLRDVTRDIRSAEGNLESAQAIQRSEKDRLESNVKKADQDLAKAESALKDISELPLAADLRNAAIDRDVARKSSIQAKVRYENMKQLFGKGGVSLQQLEQREMEYRSAMTEEKRTDLTYRLTVAGATQEEKREAQIAIELVKVALEQAKRTHDLTLEQQKENVKKSESRLNRQKVDLDRTNRLIEACTMRAPVSGTVFYRELWTGDVREKINEGMEVHPWNRLMDLPDITLMQVKVEVEEQDIGRVRINQSARITLDAYRRKEYAGKVTRIDPITKRKGGRDSVAGESEREDLGTKVVEVLVTLDSQDSDVRTGLNGRAKIRTQEQAEGLLVPSKAVVFTEGRHIVHVVTDDIPVETVVKVGQSSDVDTLILSGVKEGDVVWLNPPREKTGGRGPRR